MQSSGEDVTRSAIERGFKRYLAELVDETYAVFDVTAALRGSRGGGSRVANKLLKNSRPVNRHVVRPKLKEYQRTLSRQFEPVLNYAADEGTGFEAYADEVLAHDLYWNALRSNVRGSRRESIRERLLERQRTFGDDISPIIDAESDEFWTAVAEVYDRDAATDLVEQHFRFSAPLQDDPAVYCFELQIDPGDVLGGLARALPTLTVEFTDEALRSLQRAEERVIAHAKTEIDATYEQ